MEQSTIVCRAFKYLHLNADINIVRAALVMALLSLVFASPAPAQDTIEFKWARQFTGLGGASDRAYAVAIGDGIYVGGSTSGAIPGEASAGYHDAFVRKYDAYGNVVWSRQFGSPDYDEIMAIVVHPTGVYVAGQTTGSLPGQTSAGFTDSFISKYDSDGNQIWVHQFGTSYYDHANGIGADATGVYVGGRTSGTFPGQVSAGDHDAFVRKYDFDGNEVWTRQFGTTNFDQAAAVAANASGVYLTGRVNGALPGQTRVGGYDAFVRKYTADGTEVWTRQFGTYSYDRADGIAVDATGVYTVGRTDGAFPGFPEHPYSDGFVRKYDLDGNEQWTDQIHAQDDSASAVFIHGSGVYVAGYTSGAFPDQTYAGGGDVFVRKYAADGPEVLWTRQFGSSESENAYGVAASPLGIFVVGSTQGTLPGQVRLDSEDAFIVKYDDDGTLSWTRQFTGFKVVSPFANAVDSDGGAYVSGTIAGVFPGEVSAGGFADAFVRKYTAGGNEIWTSQFGSPDRDEAKGVFVNSTGVYVVGRNEGVYPDRSVDAFIAKLNPFDGGVLWEDWFEVSTYMRGGAFGISGDATGVYMVGSAEFLPGQTDGGAFVRKYDFGGMELWTRQFGSDSSTQAQAVHADSTGVYVAGRTHETLPGQTGSGGTIFVRKYDVEGNEVWTTQFGLSGYYSYDQASGVSVDATGVYVVGTALPEFGNNTAFVQKLDIADGAELWLREIAAPTNQYDQASGVSADGNGPYVVGRLCESNYYPVLCDAFIYKYDEGGNLLATRIFGAPELDEALGVSASSTGVYVVGKTLGETITDQSIGEGGAFVLKLVTDIPFAAFEVEKAKIKLKKKAGKDSFEVKGVFTLGEGSDGIDPPGEDVTVTFDDFTRTIPAGFFVRGDEDGDDDDSESVQFMFKGSKGGITKIKIRDDGRFEVKAKDLDLNGLDLSNPVYFSLQIGDDVGETWIPFDEKGKFKQDDDDD